MLDWQTEEDDIVWEDEPTQSKPPSPDSRRKWWLYLLPLLILVGGGLYFYQQAQRQTETAVSAIEADILSSHELLLTAVETQDRDLFHLLLSGRDMGWVSTLQRLVQKEQLLSYDIFGLTYQPDSYELQNIELSPTLDSAEVTYTLSYLTDQKERIRLEQTAVFRQGETRWLYAPPEGDYWGEWQTREEEQFTLIYPERDAEWVDSFADDLIEWLPSLCDELPDMPCETWQKSIRFDNNPNARLAFTEPASVYSSLTQINLPTPSLIGLPTDAASTIHLTNAYKAILTRAYIAEMVQYECCDKIVLFDTIMTLQLAQLGITQWPISLDTHIAYWQEEGTLPTGQLGGYWTPDTVEAISDEEAFTLNLSIDFLNRINAEMSVVELLRSLVIEPFSFNRWLTTIYFGDPSPSTPQGFDMEDVNGLWRSFAALHVDASVELPQPVPEQTLTLVCMPIDNSGRNTTVYQLDWSDATWRTAAELDGFGILFPLRDDKQIVVQSLPFNQAEALNQISLWNESAYTPIKTLASGYRISFGQMGGNGRFLASYTFPFDGETVGEARTIIYDLNSCDESGCAEIEGRGSPVWSPNGEHVIFERFVDFSFVGRLPDGRIWQSETGRRYDLRIGTTIDPRPDQIPDRFYEAEQLDFGFSPFWRNDDQFGYMRLSQESNQFQLLIGDVETGNTRIVLTEESFATFYDGRVEDWRLEYATPIPNQPNLLAIVAIDPNFTGRMFLFNVEERTLRELVSEVRMDFEHLVAFSEDGRYVATAVNNPDNRHGERETAVIDLQTMQTTTYSMSGTTIFPGLIFDFSQDSQWLSINANVNLIQLIHLPTGDRYLIKHPQGQCSSLSWITPILPTIDN